VLTAPGLSPAGAQGAYLHIPFCARRCDYCAFATWTDREHLVGRYLDALRRHAARFAASSPPVTSVFVGGGTPSLVPAEALVAVLAELPLAPGAEVTVECNPETVTPALLATYRAGGVTRLSLGVQSMVPAVLASLGRDHAPGSVVAAVAWARAQGFDQLNLDLIYGGAGESVHDWAVTLDEALALEPDHVSAYALTVEAGTPLALDVARHPDDDDQAEKYELAEQRFAQAGLTWYEISNWSRPGAECRHNLLYWSQGDYLGLGCAAHAHRQGRRWWNLRTPERWMDDVDAGGSGEAAGEDLDDETRALEALQLALRTRWGVPEAALDRTDPDLAGLVALVDGRWVLTLAGRLLANEVALRLRTPASAPAATPVSLRTRVG
jgi:putative oxygen-independent coproporphyrinogen III oxidase